jgi:hypothetical protein
MEVSHVVIPEITHGLPQVHFSDGAEDLGGSLTLPAIGGAENQAGAPRPIFSATDRQTYRDFNATDANRCKVVHNRFACVGSPEPCRLSHHPATQLVCANINAAAT